MRDLLKLVLCLLTGHNGEIEAGDRDLYIRCQRCRRRSPGWQIGASRGRRIPGKPRDVTQPVTMPWHTVPIQALVDHIDQDTANLLADLDLAGRDGDVQLLLMPPVNQLKH